LPSVYDVAARNRVWSPPKTGGYARYIEENLIPGYRKIEGVHARLDALDAAGLILHPKKGFWPGLKRYADADEGKPLQDIIYTPTGLTNFSGSERLGYPTQKPLALLRRIIAASSDVGDLVLDPFCGCATACIAAQDLQRQWVGIDISPKAAELVGIRLRDELGLFDESIHRMDIPQRTDIEPLRRYNHPDNKKRLYGKQGGNCKGCGEHFKPQNLTFDHITPRSRGGQDYLDNLQLLCGHCNSVKGDRGQEYLLAKLAT